ncbi:hypothetical protein ACFQET_00230 [Levilactobacillus tangyuanensis]|uniref:LPXTG cell wall anchor domain-containing protein n=1 Tax=Levilactobacillus tangyuanensis TaxID=2486021 RepID=A0ABW1TMJ8_9LACO|nr:hypothetical protein [Levilactobacillus tangyuanensis]
MTRAVLNGTKCIYATLTVLAVSMGLTGIGVSAKADSTPASHVSITAVKTSNKASHVTNLDAKPATDVKLASAHKANLAQDNSTRSQPADWLTAGIAVAMAVLAPAGLITKRQH